MESKNILILLISMTLLINFINYVDHDEDKTIKKIDTIKQRIAKEEALLKQKTSIDKLDHSKLFFDSKKDNNTLLGEFQKLIKTIAKESDFKITNITWGEPTHNEELSLTTIPLKLVAKSTPHHFEQFAKAIKTQKKIIKIDMITMGKSRKEISYQMYLFAYKKVKNEK